MHINPEDIVTLDFETYYDSNYTLSKGLNTSEYVRDPRFHAHMVGLRVGGNEAVWYPTAEIATVLNSIDWDTKWLLAHNCAFDGFILSHVYGIKPRGYLDTLSMSRAIFGASVAHDLDAVSKRLGFLGKMEGSLAKTKGVRNLTPDVESELGEYCAQDVDMCFSVFWKMAGHFPRDEFDVVDATIRMFCEPVLELDEMMIHRAIEMETGNKAIAILKTGSSTKELNSNPQFAARLQALGVTPPMKISVRTGKPAFAFAKTDAGFRNLLTHADPDVRELAEARLTVKSSIVETRAKRLKEAARDGYKIPVLLNYCGAHTTRFSGGNKMNMQNLPRPEFDDKGVMLPDSGLLRRALLAPPGHNLVVCDAAQIEARLTAWICNQYDLVEGFREQDQWDGTGTKPDVYKEFAAELYGIPVSQVSKEQRFIGKICVLGLGYGMGATRLQITLEQGTMGPPVLMSITECYRAVDLYRAKNYAIKHSWKLMDQILAHMSQIPAPGVAPSEVQFGPVAAGYGYVRLPNGLFLHYPGLTWNSSRQQYMYRGRNHDNHIYGSLLLENIVQALSRVLIANNMVTLHREGVRLVTMTHDEIVALGGDQENSEALLARMIDIMSTPPAWCHDLPLNAEGGFARNYSK